MDISSRASETGGIGSALRKLVLATATLLGVGYIVVSIPMIILLSYRFSQIPIASMQNVSTLARITLFLMASVLLMILGGFLVIGGLQFYRGGTHQGVIFLGSLLGSFYLMCLGAGSMLMASQVNFGAMSLIIGAVLVMGAAAIYMGDSIPFRVIGSILGIIAGVLLAIAIFNHQALELVFDWGVPFPGPFMSIAAMEAIVVILSPVTALIYSIPAGYREQPVAHSFLSIVGLVYGIGTLVGSQILALGFLDLLWKAPYEGEILYGLPPWFFGTVAFWSASLFLLMVGGIMLIVSSCFGFIYAAQEFAQL